MVNSSLSYHVMITLRSVEQIQAMDVSAVPMSASGLIVGTCDAVLISRRGKAYEQLVTSSAWFHHMQLADKHEREKQMTLL